MRVNLDEAKRASIGGSVSGKKPAVLSIQFPKATQGIWFQLIVFASAFLIVWSRRPDAILNAQFFAEDGALFYRGVYETGLRSFSGVYGGYIHIFARSVALLSLAFPLFLAPLVMNLCAIFVQILPVNVFLSSRFSRVRLDVRLLGSFIYLALPNCTEIHANLTNGQWHLALAACLLVLAEPATTVGWQIFDVAAMTLTSFSSPMGILLVPIAAVLWWKRRSRWSLLTLAALVPGSLLEALTAISSQSRQLPNGITLERFLGIVGGQVFFSALFGMKTALAYNPNELFPYAVTAAVIGAAAVIYALVSAPLELKVFILFCFAVLGLGLFRPEAGLPEQLDWGVLLVPGACNRYFFLPMLAFFASLLWIVACANTVRALRFAAIAILLLLPIGIHRDWFHRPFADFHFHEYADRFDAAPSGTRFVIPINPGWRMELTKR
jgi:hypothetical protein